MLYISYTCTASRRTFQIKNIQVERLSKLIGSDSDKVYCSNILCEIIRKFHKSRYFHLSKCLNIFECDMLFYSLGSNCFGGNCTQWGCHCAGNTCPISAADGSISCPQNCAPDWFGPGCQTGNVAIGNVENSGEIQNDTGHSLQLCFDGNLYTGSCRQNSFVIDLGDQFVIQRVKLSDARRQRVNRCRRHVFNLEIRIGNSENKSENEVCVNVKSREKCSDQITFYCKKLLAGRIVNIDRTRAQSNPIEFAEIDLVGFRYIDPTECSIPESIRCMTPSRCNYNVENQVDYLTGACKNGCSADYVGHNCDQRLVFEGKLRFSRRHTKNSVEVELRDISGYYRSSPFDSGRRRRIRLDFVFVIREVGATDWKLASAKKIYHSSRNEKYNITELSPNTEYEVGVKMRKREVNLTSSFVNRSPIFVYTLCDEPKDGPEIVSMEIEGATLTLKIKPLTQDQLSCNDTKGAWYRASFQMIDGDDEWKHTSLHTTNDFVFTISGVLDWDKRYIVKVGVQNPGNARSVYGPGLEFSTGTLLSPISWHEEEGNDRLNLSWSVLREHQDSNFEYRILYKFYDYKGCYVKQGEWNSSPFPSVVPSYKLIGLKRNARYYVKIVANATGNGVKWKYTSKQTMIETSESVPVGTAIKAIVVPETVPLKVFISTTLASVKFRDLPCEDRRGKLVGYHYRLIDYSTGEVVRENLTRSANFVLTDLMPYTKYILSYTWANKAGESERSEETEFITDETELPSVGIDMINGPAEKSTMVHFRTRGNITGLALECGETTEENIKPTEITKYLWDIEPTRMFTVTDLKSSTWYGCWAAARNKKGWSRPTEFTYIHLP
ncbi:uncharacterized protein LOC141903734 isoform X2 [Tubulanus polymorphus]|uniref:uncharacterized protein LOC141903734 isoform X2 n=1 Tax=Tubulanus polymorphus TaxID=672921 RepID=UPI003DA5543B